MYANWKLVNARFYAQSHRLQITLTRVNSYSMLLYYERTHSPIRNTINKADVLIQLIYVLVFTHPYHTTQIYNPTNIYLLSYKVYFHGKYTCILMFLV